MPTPPGSPPSSDIQGVDRDFGKVVDRRKDPHPDQQSHLSGVAQQDAARPPAGRDIGKSTTGNHQGNEQ